MKSILRLISLAICTLILCLAVGNAAFAQVSVTTYHNDNARTGQNTSETILKPANVTTNTFKKLFTGSVALDDWSAAQPLYVANVTISGTMHNVVYVATLNNSIYAFDADNGTLLWMQNYGPPTSYTTLCIDSAYQTSTYKGAGIIGTPVIDPVAGTMYFVAKTGNGAPGPAYSLILHAVDITTGIDKNGGPVRIAPTTGPQFYSRYQENRPALLLNNGVVYVGLGSTGCTGLKSFPVINNHGYVLGYNATKLKLAPSMFVTTPNTNQGGIWQDGGGLAADANGHIYFETADGIFDADSGGSDYSDSVVELDGNLNLVDFFTPYNQATFDTLDLDMSSVAPVVLPDQTVGPTHLLVASGKAEEVYVLDRDNMGGYCSACTTTNTNILQDVQRPSYMTGCQPSTSGTFTCRHGAISYWNNTIFFPGVNSPLLAYSMVDGVVNSTPVKSAYGYWAVDSPSITSSGTTNGIAWLITVGPGPTSNGTLRAFDPVTLKMLYNSDAAAGGRDTLGQAAHFIVPTVVNGKVYVATQTQLVVYGNF
jgi:PQQ enzyme repeat